MKKTKKRALYIVAALLAVVFVLACLAGFAACGGDDTSTADCGDGNHTVASWTTVTEATCTSKGSESGTCTVCGKTVTQDIPMKDHTSDEGTVTKAATCTEKGEMTYKCTVCGTVLGTEDVAALGHTYDGLAYKEGKLVTVCSVCGVEATGSEATSVDATEYTFEAEDMILNAGTSTSFGVEEHSTASGGYNVKDFGEGTSVTYIITASAATQAVLTVVGCTNNAYITPTDLDMSNASVTLNNQSITLSGTYPTGGMFNYSNWSDAATATINLVQGENTIVFKGMAKDYQYNLDAIRVAVPATTTLKVSSSVCEDANCGGHKLVGTYADNAWTYACTLCEEIVDLAATLVPAVKSLTMTATDDSTLTAANTNASTLNLSNADVVINVEPSDSSATTISLSLTSLSADIVLADGIYFTVSTTLSLDLNGHTISSAKTLTEATNTIEVGSAGSLTISDGSYTAANGETPEVPGTGAIANTYTGATSTDCAAAIKTDGTVTLTSGTIESSSVGVRALGGTVTINGGTIESGYYAIWESKGEVTVTINDGAVTGSNGIFVAGDSKEGYETYQSGAKTTLIVNGGTVTASGDSAISANGLANRDTVYIEINGGEIATTAGVVLNDDQTTVKTSYPAIYLPNGNLKITGGTITGSTAVEVRGGTVVISGGTLKAGYYDENGDLVTGDDAAPSGNGAKTYGYALSVYPYQHTARSSESGFVNTVSVSVTDGTFEGDIYVAATAAKTNTGEELWTVVLNGDETAKQSASYVVDISGLDMTYTEVTESSQTVAYVFSYTQRVTGSADEGEGVSHKFGEVTFDESSVSATYDATTGTYTLEGTSGTMSANQSAAFWGDANHTGCGYVAFTINLCEGETATVTSYNGTEVEKTVTLSYGGDCGFTLDLGGSSSHTGSSDWSMVVEITDGTNTYTYTVVLGTITPAVSET